jgi:hypothetical protein
MRYAPILFLALVLIGSYATPGPAKSSAPVMSPAPPAVIYTQSDAMGGWHIRGDRYWSGFLGQLYTRPLSQASTSVAYSRTAGVTCIDLGGMIFAASDAMYPSARFQCGTASFEVVDCNDVETCRHARIVARWQTGIAPDYRSLSLFYWYNNCRGIESITFENPGSVGFGQTLELRQGPGLLAEPDEPDCRSGPLAALYAASAQPTAIYSEGSGRDAWRIQGDRFWNGDPRHLGMRPLARAPAGVVRSRTADAACVDLAGMIFGAPETLRLGVQFQCGTARFEVVECENPERCGYARIAATWRTGVAPNQRPVPVFYWYNRCRGIESITFSLARPLRVGFGETLELRQGPGLLAQPDSPACRNDPRSALYD